MKNIIIVIFAVFALTNCEETIELDLKQTEEKVVIEALVTDEYTQHQVKLSKVSPFNSSGVDRVGEALITVEDDKGNVYEYEETSLGIYQSKDAFAGVVGNVYTLRVEVGDEIFIASEDLRRVTAIDSLTIRIDQEEQADPEDEGRFYEMLVYTKEPQETEDFYLFKFYRNGGLENFDGGWVFVSDDEAIGQQVSGLPAPVYYAEGDVGRIEMYSLTRQAYRYWLDLDSNINNDGGMFSGQPANVRTNIEGGAIGYFQVSGVAIGEIVIK